MLKKIIIFDSENNYERQQKETATEKNNIQQQCVGGIFNILGAETKRGGLSESFTRGVTLSLCLVCGLWQPTRENEEKVSVEYVSCVWPVR